MVVYTETTETSDVVAAFPERVRGKTIVITGASAGGLGAGSALALAAAKPKHLILLGRSESKVKPVIDEIAAIDSSILTQFVKIELDSQESVRDAAKVINASVTHIDYLLNVAGIMATETYHISKEGIELQFAVNHIGHFLLTNLVLPKLCPGSRVISVSSSAHFASPIRFHDYNFDNGKAYDRWLAYGQAKSANVLFAVSLADKLKSRGIGAFSMHPASTMTNLSRDFPLDTDWDAITVRLSALGMPRRPLKSSEQSCATIVAGALDPSLEAFSGAYLDDCKVAPAAPHSVDPLSAEKLWILSETLVGQKFIC